ncbi:replication initiation protein RepM [Pseudomonas helleri]|uniref:replication initiation protein RepM n=1 Tax=Pseudomonas helleri TaxID=1608996 RepID=UPI003FCF6989
MAKTSELVVKSNRLVEACYRLNLIEQQIILFAISRSRDEQLGLSPNNPVTIAASAFAKVFGTNESKVYGQLKEALGDLFERSVTIYDTDPATGKDRTVTTRWISDKAYIDGAGHIQLTFAPRVIPYITRLESEFTSYRLEKISGMSSAHAVRLYELLVQYLTIGKREIELSDLRKSLGLTDEYKAIKDFKKRVIDVAVAQINEHSDIRVSYTQRKTGRTVSHLIFAIKPEPKSDQVKRKKGHKLTDAEIEEQGLALPGESWEAARARLNQMPLDLA